MTIRFKQSSGRWWALVDGANVYRSEDGYMMWRDESGREPPAEVQRELRAGVVDAQRIAFSETFWAECPFKERRGGGFR